MDDDFESYRSRLKAIMLNRRLSYRELSYETGVSIDVLKGLFRTDRRTMRPNSRNDEKKIIEFVSNSDQESGASGLYKFDRWNIISDLQNYSSELNFNLDANLYGLFVGGIKAGRWYTAILIIGPHQGGSEFQIICRGIGDGENVGWERGIACRRGEQLLLIGHDQILEEGNAAPDNLFLTLLDIGHIPSKHLFGRISLIGLTLKFQHLGPMEAPSLSSFRRFSPLTISSAKEYSWNLLDEYHSLGAEEILQGEGPDDFLDKSFATHEDLDGFFQKGFRDLFAKLDLSSWENRREN